MRAAVVKKLGKPEVIEVVKGWPVPSIADPHDVLVRVAYAGLNPVDTYIRGGLYGSPELPFITGEDGAGVVEAVGKTVKGLKKGDRVWFFGAQTVSANGSGSTAEYAIATYVFPLPKGVTFAEGACLGIPYLTAHRAIFLKGHAKKGSTLLVHGASGGVGTAAVQFGVAAGLRVAGTAGTPEGLELVRRLGASTVANHKKRGYEDELKKNFPNGFDFIAEMLANVNASKDADLLAEDGQIAVIGSRGATKNFDFGDLMFKESAIFGVALGARAKPDEIRTGAEAVNELLEGGARPVVHSVYELDEVVKAHVDIMSSSGGAKGNLVIRIADLE